MKGTQKTLHSSFKKKNKKKTIEEGYIYLIKKKEKIFKTDFKD